MLDFNFTFTKRQLGMGAIMAGVVALVGVFLYDALGLSDPNGGFGPSQQAGVGLAILTIFIGFSLLPLGDTPA